MQSVFMPSKSFIVVPGAVDEQPRLIEFLRMHKDSDLAEAVERKRMDFVVGVTGEMAGYAMLLQEAANYEGLRVSPDSAKLC